MFELLGFISELLFGSSSSLSQDSFEYLSSHLHVLIHRFLQQAFAIALRSKRTRLLGEDLQLVLRCRALPPLFGYCCSSTTNTLAPFQVVRQGTRTLFVQTDTCIDLHKKDSFQTKCVNLFHRLTKERTSFLVDLCSLSPRDLLLHVEWLVIAGEQHVPPLRCPSLNKSILHTEQQLYLSFVQSKRLDEEIWKIIRDDQLALDSVLGPLTEWSRHQIRDCLLYSCRQVKRRQLAYHLTLIDRILQNSSTTIDRYLSDWSSMLITCLLYRFELDDDDVEESDRKRAIETGCIWSIRGLAAGTCVKLLQRSHCLVYNVLYTRIIARLLHSLTDPSNPPSLVHAILDLFEKLGPHAIRAFLLPHLHSVNPSTMFASKPIRDVLERIALMIDCSNALKS